MQKHHIRRPSRNGDVMELPKVVCTEYAQPNERVLFDAQRDANPFFHFMESLWMLAGRNDVAWLSQFNSRIANFSNDGKTFAGAYGWRWRRGFDLDPLNDPDDCDQLSHLVRMLKANPNERRGILMMWNPQLDLDQPQNKDVCCNIAISFYRRPVFPESENVPNFHRLDMVVFNRSNDISWGVYGANIVHMSTLHEYMASMIGCPLGTYSQISVSWHAYAERWRKETGINPETGAQEVPAQDIDRYVIGIVRPYPLITDPESWDMELERWMDCTDLIQLEEPSYKNSFFPEVAQPLFNAWMHWKCRDFYSAIDAVTRCKASDWRYACIEWLQRRAPKQGAE